MVYLADCVDLMKIIPSGSVDVVFADPPYRLSRGGVTVKNGRLAPVDKGAWDRSMGFAEDHRFNVRWLKEACRILKPEGTIWVTGTHHIIFSLGFALQTMKLKLINQITWAKPDPPPNALHTAFTHAHETLLWASKGRGVPAHLQLRPHQQQDPKAQVSSVWSIPFRAQEGEAPRLPSHPEAPSSGSPRHRCFQQGGGSHLRSLLWIWYHRSSLQGAGAVLCGGGEGRGVRGACGAQDRGCGARGSVTRAPHPENGWPCRVTSKEPASAPWLGGGGCGSGS